MNKGSNHTMSDIESILATEAPSQRASLLRTWDAAERQPDEDAYRDLWQKTVWESIEAQLVDDDNESSTREDGFQGVSLFRFAAAAAVIAALVGIGLVLIPVSHEANPGEIHAMVLPDGSFVELNSGSTIEFGRWFFTGRNVKLTGEAFFDVVDSGDPFVVETFNARVHVVGTQFNVRAWGQTTVSVVSGTVNVSSLSASRSISLIPDDHAVVHGLDVARIDQLDNEAALAWRKGDFVFADERLDLVAAEIERRFAVRVRLSGVGLADRRVTTNLRQPLSVETVVRDVCEALGLRYRRTSDGFELFAESVG